MVALDDLRSVLLSPEEAAAMDAHGTVDAAVLVPLYGTSSRPGLVFTKRPAHLRKHAGEISFPGGRQDEPDEDLRATALREADEEIGLPASGVELIGALPPTATVVTSYRIHPFVGLIAEDAALTPNPDEVESVLHFGLDELIAGYARRRLVRRGVPFRTDTFVVDGEMIWGATARILRGLLDRMEPLLR